MKKIIASTFLLLLLMSIIGFIVVTWEVFSVLFLVFGLVLAVFVLLFGGFLGILWSIAQFGFEEPWEAFLDVFS